MGEPRTSREPNQITAEPADMKGILARWSFPTTDRLGRNLSIGLQAIVLFTMIHVGAYWLRFEGNINANRWYLILCTLLSVLVTKTLVFAAYGIHRKVHPYFNFYDMVQLTQAATTSAVLLLLIDYLILSRLSTPRSVFFMDWGATIVVIGGLFALRRLVREGGQRLTLRRGVPVLIVGADEHGESLLRAIRGIRALNYDPIGFVAVEANACGQSIGGVPVVGTVDEVASLANDSGVTELLIASGGLSGKQVRQLIQAVRSADVVVKVLPGYDELLAGRMDLRPREVSISDLLRRDPVRLDQQHLHQWLDHKVLFVTGAAGSIGSEICRQLLQFRPTKLVVVDRSENGQFFLERELRAAWPDQSITVHVADIADRPRMSDLFRLHQPDIVFHAAAYKHVPLMEANCSEALKNIPLATEVLADLADEHRVTSFVMISTDKAVNPTSVMGASKRVAEMYVQALSSQSVCRFVTVRFGNVLDSAGSVVPIFRRQIAEGGPITVTHPEMQRYFMTIPEASQLVIQAGAMGQGGEIFVLDMGEPVRIVDLARDMIRLSGLRENDDIEIQFTGVRPGEKLFEELHIDGETHRATSHNKIVVAVGEPSTLEEARHALRRLRLAALRTDDDIVRELASIVPEFTPARIPVPANRKAA